MVHFVPVQPTAHWQLYEDPDLTHVPPFLHGELMHGLAATSEHVDYIHSVLIATVARIDVTGISGTSLAFTFH